jgi:pimeloyl-ACP methyl ester carboxylesterase
MDERWTVLGGWGVDPGVLQPVFGGDAVYLDVNELTASLVTGRRWPVDWQQRCVAAITPRIRQPRLLAGWSTGAMIALGCASLLHVDALVLISATASFCRTPVHSIGIHPRIIATMRRKLLSDRNTVLHDFRIQCGLPDAASAAAAPWSTETLVNGLHALEAINLVDVPPPSCTPLLIHGTQDMVIPFAAGELLHQSIGGTLCTLHAPHACFVNNESAIISSINDYLEGLRHESV